MLIFKFLSYSKCHTFIDHIGDMLEDLLEDILVGIKWVIRDVKFAFGCIVDDFRTSP